MTSDSPAEKNVAETFDELAHDRCCRYKSKGLTGSSQVLLDLLLDNGLDGKTVLDVGCGTGFFAIETLRHGVSFCVGIDLSPAAIKEANEYASESGVQARTRFEVANAASTTQPESDVVVLDKVLCCYPGMEELLRSATVSSKDLLGFVIPRDEGFFKPLLRIGVGSINLVERLKKSGFRMYLHSLRSVNQILEQNGFRKVKKSTSRFWSVFLYQRSGPSTTRQHWS